VVKNRMRGRIFEPKRGVTGGSRKFQNGIIMFYNISPLHSTDYMFLMSNYGRESMTLLSVTPE
jgi:hypothetical protein